ncbi:hypothetical protein GCM10027578_15770 [Spirosoma luteolum]
MKRLVQEIQGYFRDWSKASTPELFRAIQRGDQKAIDWLYCHNYGPVIRQLGSRGATPEQAQDVYQDAFTDCWLNVTNNRFTPQENATIHAYLRAIALRHWLKALRQTQPVTFSETGYMDADLSDDDYAGDVFELRMQELDAALTHLSPRQRQLLDLFYIRQLSMDAIARELGLLNAGMAKKTKYQAMQTLRDLMNRTPDDL